MFLCTVGSRLQDKHLPLRILLIRTDRMGDLLLSLPAVHAVRTFFPKMEIALLVQKGLEPLIKGHPDIDDILMYRPEGGKGWKGIFRWAWQLRKHRFHMVIVLNPTRLFHIATFLAGIPTRVGYKRKWGFLLSASILDTKAVRNSHEVDYNLELVRLLGIPPSDPVLALPKREEADLEVQRLFQFHSIALSSRPIALHPWTSNPTKGWPLESFQEVVQRLSHLNWLKQPILIIGGEEWIPAMKQWGLPELNGPTPVINLVGQVSLSVLPALLRRCTALVSNDSGPVHVAAAVGTPTVVVAPQSHASLLARWRPLGNGHQILLSPTPEEVVAALPPCES